MNVSKMKQYVVHFENLNTFIIKKTTFEIIFKVNYRNIKKVYCYLFYASEWIFVNLILIIKHNEHVILKERGKILEIFNCLDFS